jgi:hypothetical protein
LDPPLSQPHPFFPCSIYCGIDICWRCSHRNEPLQTAEYIRRCGKRRTTTRRSLFTPTPFLSLSLSPSIHMHIHTQREREIDRVSLMGYRAIQLRWGKRREEKRNHVSPLPSKFSLTYYYHQHTHKRTRTHYLSPVCSLSFLSLSKLRLFQSRKARKTTRQKLLLIHYVTSHLPVFPPLPPPLLYSQRRSTSYTVDAWPGRTSHRISTSWLIRPTRICY